MTMQDKTERNIQRKEHRKWLKEQILELLGRQCSNCSYRKDERALQLDHIDGNPDPRHRAGSMLYAAILNGTISDHLFQILCANCNVIKMFSNPVERQPCRKTEEAINRQKWRAERRQSILNLYGRKCSNCGYRRNERALQLDHIEGNPDPRYRGSWKLYDAILSGVLPKQSFQILCANCNFIKRLITPNEQGSWVNGIQPEFPLMEVTQFRGNDGYSQGLSS